MSRTQLEAARRMLRELSDLAEHASLTGSMSGGASHAARRYNSILSTLEDEGVVPEGMFTQLDPDRTEFGQLAVDTRLLLASVREEDEEEDDDDDEDEHCGHGGGHGIGALVALAPFLDREDLARLVRERLGDSGPIKDGLLIALAPFLDKSMLGEIVNRRIRPNAPAAPKPPAAAEPVAPPAPVHEVVSTGTRLPEVAPNEELARLAARLAQPDISAEERSQIAVRLSELALQQGQMAQDI